MKPVTIIMSVYNTDFALVKRAIDSALGLDFQDFELLVIDDGSDNGTENQLLHYCKSREDIITYIRHRNLGQAASINRGVLLAKGAYIAILDADDEYKTHYLSACLAEIDGWDLMASTTETIVDSEEDYYVPDKNNPKQGIHVDDCILFATLFGKREVFLSLPFAEGYSADSDFYERATEIYRVKKVDLRAYVYYRNIPSSICSVFKKQQQDSLL